MSTTLAPTETTTAIATYELKGEPQDEPQGDSAFNAACDVRQRPISVTLDGPSIFTLAVALVLFIHFLGSHSTQILVSLTPVFLLVRNDYQNFISLGPGGTPSTFQGYLRISWLRLWALRDPFTTVPKADPDRVPNQGILRGPPLPYRAGPRPLVAGIAPQRQLDQHGSRSCYLSLRRAMEKLSVRNPLKFGTERSCLEKHGLALFARHPLQTNCQGEICHIHDFRPLHAHVPASRRHPGNLEKRLGAEAPAGKKGLAAAYARVARLCHGVCSSKVSFTSLVATFRNQGLTRHVQMNMSSRSHTESSRRQSGTSSPSASSWTPFQSALERNCHEAHRGDVSCLVICKTSAC